MASDQERPLLGILLKVASVLAFVVMSALLKAAEGVPAGELVFFRSAFAIFPVIIFLAWRRQLSAGVRTSNLPGHFLRGLVGVISMGLGFYALTKLPLPESVSLGYAMPLFVVMFSALFLKERVHLFRWTAVLVGLAGVGIMVWPRLTVFSGQQAMGTDEAYGVIAAMIAAAFAAWAMLQVRRLTRTERTETIVFYFSISAAVLALFTVPFGWVWPTPQQAVLLVLSGFVGGVAQILLTSSYRYAAPSLVAPFEYSSLLLSLVIGYFAFGDVPTVMMLVGATIVMTSGIAVILREHRLGLDRAKSRAANTL